MAKRDYKGRLKLKVDVVDLLAKLLKDAGYDYVKVVDGLALKVDDDYVVVDAVVKKADYDVADGVDAYADKVKKAADRAKAKADKLAKAKAKADKAKA